MAFVTSFFLVIIFTSRVPFDLLAIAVAFSLLSFTSSFTISFNFSSVEAFTPEANFTSLFLFVVSQLAHFVDLIVLRLLPCSNFASL